MKIDKETVRLILLNQEEIMNALGGIAANIDHTSSRELLTKAANRTCQHINEFYPRTH